jgi:hypothetical protein
MKPPWGSRALALWFFSGAHISMVSHFLDTSLNILSLSITYKNSATSFPYCTSDPPPPPHCQLSFTLLPTAQHYNFQWLAMSTTLIYTESLIYIWQILSVTVCQLTYHIEFGLSTCLCSCHYWGFSSLHHQHEIQQNGRTHIHVTQLWFTNPTE